MNQPLAPSPPANINTASEANGIADGKAEGVRGADRSKPSTGLNSMQVLRLWEGYDYALVIHTNDGANAAIGLNIGESNESIVHGLISLAEFFGRGPFPVKEEEKSEGAGVTGWKRNRIAFPDVEALLRARMDVIANDVPIYEKESHEAAKKVDALLAEKAEITEAISKLSP